MSTENLNTYLIMDRRPNRSRTINAMAVGLGECGVSAATERLSLDADVVRELMLDGKLEVYYIGKPIKP